jgi:hypothetical protein
MDRRDAEPPRKAKSRPEFAEVAEERPGCRPEKLRNFDASAGTFLGYLGCPNARHESHSQIQADVYQRTRRLCVSAVNKQLSR